MTRVGRAAAPAVLAVALAMVSGCSGSERNNSTAKGAGAAGIAAERAGGGSASGTGSGAQRTTSALARAALQGDVVYTADVSVSARDVEQAASRTREIVDSAGGWVVDDNVRTGGGAGADITFKVPPAAFQGVLDRLQRDVQKVTTVHQQADDVTDQVVDVEARLSVQRTSVKRVQDLMTQAKSLSDIVQLEGDLTRRQADLESLERQLAALKDQVGMATLTVHVTRAAVPAGHQRVEGFLGGLAVGWHAFATTAGGALVVLGAVLPFGLVAALVAAIWLVRRRGRPTHA